MLKFAIQQYIIADRAATAVAAESNFDSYMFMRRAYADTMVTGYLLLFPLVIARPPLPTRQYDT